MLLKSVFLGKYLLISPFVFSFVPLSHGEYGRARSIEEAIIMHGGEAINSKNAFQNLSETDKNALLKFIKSL